VKALGRKVRPDIWERYLLGPESGPDASKYITELNVPLA
jgi:effector-binding domain-containing protein